MEKDGLLVGVFPTPSDRAVVLTPSELLKYVDAEMESYE